MRNWSSVRLTSLPKITQLPANFYRGCSVSEIPAGPWGQHYPTQAFRGGSRFPGKRFPSGVSIRSVLFPKSMFFCTRSLLPSPSLIMTNVLFHSSSLPLKMNFCWWLLLGVGDALKQKIVTKETTPGTASGLFCVSGGKGSGFCSVFDNILALALRGCCQMSRRSLLWHCCFSWKYSVQLSLERRISPFFYPWGHPQDNIIVSNMCLMIWVIHLLKTYGNWGEGCGVGYHVLQQESPQ